MVLTLVVQWSQQHTTALLTWYLACCVAESWLQNGETIGTQGHITFFTHEDFVHACCGAESCFQYIGKDMCIQPHVILPIGAHSPPTPPPAPTFPNHLPAESEEPAASFGDIRCIAVQPDIVLIELLVEPGLVLNGPASGEHKRGV